MSTPPLAFVAGATGYTGRAVVTRLVARGVRTVAHVRPGSASGDAGAARLATLGAAVDRTPWEPAAMRAALTRLQPAFVFALLGTTRRRAAREGIDAPYEAVDYGLTALLHDAAAACGAAPRFVYLSAMGAAESSGNPYLKVRGRMERELREGPLPWLVAQPAFVTGSDREEFRLGERVGAVATDAVLALVGALGGGRLRDRYASLTGAQLAAGLVALALADPTGRLRADAAMLRAAARTGP